MSSLNSSIECTVLWTITLVIHQQEKSWSS
jgi:hypothetical protein